MKHARFCVCLTLLCALTCALPGCHRATGSRPGLAPASGVVTYNGRPVEGATIEMRPVDESIENCVAAALTDEQGRFVMLTDRPGDGAMPGQYKTVVKKVKETIDGMTRDEYVRSISPDGRGDVVFDKDKIVYVNELPDQYADPETTPLTIEIPKKGNKKIQIDLKD